MFQDLQQCDHCLLVRQSNRWPYNDDGFMFCPRCGHDESAFLDLWRATETRMFRELLQANYPRWALNVYAGLTRRYMGPYNPSYIRGIDP